MEYFVGTIVNPQPDRTVTITERGVLGVNDGKIRSVGKFDPRDPKYASAEVTDFGRRGILPANVDGHVHMPQNTMRGRHGHRDLMDWLKYETFPTETGFTPVEARRKAPEFFRQLIDNGTTTAAVYVTSNQESTHEAFVAAEKSGVRVVMGMVLMDREAPDALLVGASQAIGQHKELVEKWDGKDGRLKVAVTPRFAIATTDELLALSGQVAEQYDSPIQTHISESRGELDAIRQLFGPNRTYAQIYDNAHLLGPRTILAHAIYPTDEEFDLIESRGAGIVHCPTSNLFLNSGIMPMGRVIDRIPLALGSDVGGGWTLNMREVMRTAITSQDGLHQVGLNHGVDTGARPDLDAATVLHMATRGGARVLGMEDIVGAFEKDMDADFVVFDPAKIDSALETDPVIYEPEKLLNSYVFEGDKHALPAVYIRGVQRGGTTYQAA